MPPMGLASRIDSFALGRPPWRGDQRTRSMAL
jgi:hypothetical protein